MGTDPIGTISACIGIGSNLEDPLAQVLAAVEALDRLPLTRLAACSAIYRTAPVGPVDQPDYVNAVARLDTGLSPEDLLAALQAVERRHGRVRNGTRWGPRTLDLDILLYGDLRIAGPALRIPHPEMGKRAFVLVPLADVVPPDLAIPGMGPLAALLAACPPGGVEPLAPPPRGCDAGGPVAESDPRPTPDSAD